MNCVGCNCETVDHIWGPWCDNCGGVVVGRPPRLFFRHVATVEGAGGRYPVVYDISTESYGVAWPKKVILVKCVHCGLQTPIENPKKDLTHLEDMGVPKHYSHRGSLDAMLALIQPIARGDSNDIPELIAAPSATELEKKLIYA